MDANQTVHIGAKIPAKLKERVERLCEREDRPISSVIRIALTRYCDKAEQ